MRVRVHAAHVVPVASAPVVDGWVDVDGAAILGVGPTVGPDVRPDASIDLGQVVVLPALVNAHTHLELSHLRGAVPPASSFLAWIRALLEARAATPTASGRALAGAIEEAVRSGTGALADIGNTRAAVAALAVAGIDAWHFDERLGFRAGRGPAVAREAWQAAGAGAEAEERAAGGRGAVRTGVAAHAPYSTAPDLIAGIVAGLDEDAARRSSIHLAESPEELQLLAEGRGPWRAMLEAVGTWDPTWVVPGCSPVRYLETLGALHPRLLVVHGTQLTRDDLDRLARAGCTLVLCPRSNAWVGVGAPPVAAAFASGVRVALGTDSLASVPDLDMFAELAALHRLAPDVPAARLLDAATRGGADALGFDHLGAIVPGRSMRLLVVGVPAGITDVEDWLVSGAVTPEAVRWLPDCLADAVGAEAVAG